MSDRGIAARLERANRAWEQVGILAAGNPQQCADVEWFIQTFTPEAILDMRAAEAAAFRRGVEARDRQIVEALTITPSLRAGREDSPWLKGLDAAREIIAALPPPEDKR